MRPQGVESLPSSIALSWELFAALRISLEHKHSLIQSKAGGAVTDYKVMMERERRTVEQVHFEAG